MVFQKALFIWMVCLGLCASTASKEVDANIELFSKSLRCGVLDLSEWDTRTKPILKIEQEWKFWWHSFLSPSKASSFPEEVCGQSNMSWSRFKIRDAYLPAHGYATYYKKIYLPKEPQNLGFKLQYIGYAYELFINGEFYHRAGKISKTKKGGQSLLKPTLIEMISMSDSLEIVFHVSNYDELKSGLWFPLYLGELSEMRNSLNRSIAYDLLVAGGLFFMGLYHFVLWFVRRSAMSNLWFGFFSIAIGLRSLFTSERFITSIIPNISWLHTQKIEYLTFFMGVPLFMLYLFGNYKRLNLKVIKWTSFLPFIPLNLWVVFGTSENLPKILGIGQFFAFLNILIACWVLWMAHKKGYPMVKAFFIGSLALFLATINDILTVNQLISSVYLTPFGLLLFSFSQSLILSTTFLRSLFKIESLFKELKVVNEALDRFVPRAFLDKLGHDKISLVKLGDSIEQETTIMFSDVVGFTQHTQNMNPKDVFKFVNHYLKYMLPIVPKYEGVVDKIMGDGVLSFFPENPEYAIRAAIEMQNALSILNLESLALGFPQMEIGIGIHRARTVLGTVGTEEHMENTVVSEGVNLGSRIERLTREYGGSILVSSSTLAHMKNSRIYRHRRLGSIKVRGVNDKVDVIEILEGQPDWIVEAKLSSIPEFNQGLYHLDKKRFKESQIYFLKALDICPEDRAALKYLEVIQKKVKANPDFSMKVK